MDAARRLIAFALTLAPSLPSLADVTAPDPREAWVEPCAARIELAMRASSDETLRESKLLRSAQVEVASGERTRRLSLSSTAEAAPALAVGDDVLPELFAQGESRAQLGRLWAAWRSADAGLVAAARACLRDGVIRRASALAIFDGKPIAVAGTYRAIAPPARRGKPAAKIYAQLELEDGRAVYLEPYGAKLAERDERERARFDGQRVIVEGTYWKIMPGGGERPLAPCLSGARIHDGAEPAKK